MITLLPTIRSIDLDENGTPETVTIKLTVQHLAEITKVLGKMSPATGATEGTAGFYHCVVSELFNRYWDAGLRSYLKEYGDGS